MTDCLIKLVVVFRLEFTLRTLPECRGAVYLVNLIFTSGNITLVIIFFLLVMQINWEGNMIAVTLNQFFNLPATSKLLAVIIQMHFDCRTCELRFIKAIFFCSSAISRNFINIIRVCTVARPVPDFSVACSLAGININFFSSHKCRIKSNTKLTNKGRIFGSIRRQSLHKSLGSGAGNSSQVVGKVFVVHTNTRILNSKHAVLFIKRNINTRLKLNALVSVIRNRQILKLIQRIRPVRNNFPQENILI